MENKNGNEWQDAKRNDKRVWRVGIVGCGGLGRIHAQCIAQIEDMESYAYCDLFIAQAEAMLQQFGGSYATDQLDRLLQDEQIDAIYVTTQHDTHAEFCIRALDAGKHVLVEKPLALTTEDCLRIGEAVNRTGKKLMTAFKMRYYHLLQKAKELIPKPLVVSMQMMDDRWGEGLWVNDPIKGGGNVLSQGCHSADILRYVAGGDPVEVYATGGNYYQSSGVVDNMVAAYRFDNGVSGSLIQGDCHCPSLPSKFFLQMYAENCSLTLSDRLTTLIFQKQGQEPVIMHGEESGFMEENIAFLKCMQEDTPPPIDHIDGLYGTLMILQAIESINSRQVEPIQALVERVER